MYTCRIIRIHLHFVERDEDVDHEEGSVQTRTTNYEPSAAGRQQTEEEAAAEEQHHH